MNGKIKSGLVLLAVLTITACQSGSDELYHNQASKPFSSSVNQNQGNVYSVDQRGEDIDEQDDQFVGEDNTRRYLIKHHKVECEGFHVQHCLLVKGEEDDDWNYFYDHIEGFDYQWGIDYDIVVRVEEIDTLVADMSQQRFTLLSVISEQAHTDSLYFEYTTKRTHENVREIAPSQFNLLGAKAFTCSAEVCDAVRSAMSQQHSAILKFQHHEEPGQPLKLTSVACSDSQASFAASCL